MGRDQIHGTIRGLQTLQFPGIAEIRSICDHLSAAIRMGSTRGILGQLLTFACILMISAAALLMSACGVTGASGGTTTPPPTSPQTSMAPSSQDFGDLDIGTASNPLPITISNTGSADLVISGLSASPSQFTVAGPSSTTIASGKQVVYNVTFAPTDAQSYSGALTVTTNASPATASVSLTGKGHKHQAAVSPTTMAFGTQTANTTSAPQTVTVTNTGAINLVISNVAASPSQFVYSGPSSATVAPGAKVSYNVTFTPAGAQTYSGSMSFSASSAFSVAPVSLSGTGTSVASSQLVLNPTSLAFGNVVTGSSSTKSVTVSNSGTASITISQISLSGAGFSTSGVTPPVTIAAGQSTSLSVTFAPTTTASISGTISIV